MLFIYFLMSFQLKLWQMKKELVNTENMIQDVSDCISSVTIQLNWLQFGPIIWDKTSIEGEIPNTINVSLIFSSNFLSDTVRGREKRKCHLGLMRSIKSTMAVSSLKFSQPEISLFRILVVTSMSYYERINKIPNVFMFPFKLHDNWKRNYLFLW